MLKDKIKKYVRKLPAVSFEASLKEAAEVMVQNDVSCAVVEVEGEVAGVVTHGDVISYMAAGKVSKKAGEIMSACSLGGGVNPCLQLSEWDTMENAMKVMGISGVHHLLVVGHEGKCSGVVSSRDVLRAIFEK